MRVVLLTRVGCVDTETMWANLEAAASALTPPAEFTVVDLETLRADDVRRGYPTPTLLFNNRDVFGLAEPKPPLPQPTWRFYRGGVPSHEVMREALAKLRT